MAGGAPLSTPSSGSSSSPMTGTSWTACAPPSWRSTGGGSTKYPGNYAEYLERGPSGSSAEKAEQRRSTILRRELEWLKRGPRARTGKDKGRKRRIQDPLDARVRRSGRCRTSPPRIAGSGRRCWS